MNALLLTLILAASPLYLDAAPSGKDSNSCTTKAPCKTVKGAIAKQPDNVPIVVRWKGQDVVRCDAAKKCSRIFAP